MTVRSGQGRKRMAAIAALLNSPTIGHAAQTAGVSESTLKRWLREEPFLREYRLAQREALGQAIANLQAVAGSAVTVLRAAMLDQRRVRPRRVAAARVILEFSFAAPRWPSLRSVSRRWRGSLQRRRRPNP